MENDSNDRRERELKSTLEQINSYKQKNIKTKWKLDIPVHKICIEGIFVFLMAFLVGRGLGVLYRILF